MKCYYIDDSFFRPSPFLREMRNRFFKLCRNEQISLILISCSKLDTRYIETFLSLCKEEGIQAIFSPASFDVASVKGVLTSTQLTLEGFAPMSTYSGSVLFIDTDTKSYERIYLEFFANHVQEDLFQDIGEEIERMLSDLLKNPKDNNSNLN